MGTLCPGKGRRFDCHEGRGGRIDFYLDTLMTHQPHARPSVEPTAPVTPEYRLRPDEERMQQHAYLARFGGRAPTPLTLFAKKTGATTANAGCIHYAQAPIGLSALLMGTKLLRSRTTQHPIRLEDKILPREAARFL